MNREKPDLFVDLSKYANCLIENDFMIKEPTPNAVNNLTNIIYQQLKHLKCDIRIDEYDKDFIKRRISQDSYHGLDFLMTNEILDVVKNNKENGISNVVNTLNQINHVYNGEVNHLIKTSLELVSIYKRSVGEDMIEKYYNSIKERSR